MRDHEKWSGKQRKMYIKGKKNRRRRPRRTVQEYDRKEVS